MVPALRFRGAVLTVATGLATLSLSAPALGTVFTPDITADANTNDGHCSLREAVQSNFTGAPSGAMSGECPAGTGNDVIQLKTGHYVLAGAADDDDNLSGDLDIKGSLAIQGAGAATTSIDAQHNDRVLELFTGFTLTITGVTITGGRSPNGADGGALSAENGEPGGGILAAGPLTLTDSVVTGNATGDGGKGASVGGADGTNPGDPGILGAGFEGAPGGRGGAIRTQSPLTLVRTAITHNTTGNGGAGGNGFGGDGAAGSTGGHGGAASGGDGGTGGDGGAIYAFGPVTLTDSTVSQNAAGRGGAGGDASAGTGGAGTSVAGGAGGIGQGGPGGFGGSAGGISANAGATISGSTISDNTAGAGGVGGLAVGNTGGAGTGGANAGAGGQGTGGPGGDGGQGAGLQLFTPSTIVNSTVNGNAAGRGGDGGNGTGGSGGQASGGGSNANGGKGITGAGGFGGFAGGLIDDTKTQVVQATITGNKVGAGGDAGKAVAGQPNGGTTIQPAGDAGTGGGVVGGSPAVLVNTIVAFNSGGNCAGVVNDGGHNLTFGDSTCPGVVADPQLGPLQNNGGLTATQAIAAGSPAHDAVPASGASCPATDQRGVSRPQGTACDTGAFELQPGPAGGPPPDTVAPVFTRASLAPKVFRVNRKGTAETAVAARKKRPKGTRFRYTLSEPARVVFTIQKAARGRKVGKKCRKPTRSNRRKRACKRFVRTGRFAVVSIAGANSHRFSGRIGKRVLKPGRYRAVLVAIDAAGNRSVAKRLTFRVVR
jgi:hypothetical protein